MPVPVVLHNRDFSGYLLGVVLSQIGTRGAMAASLYQVYELSGSLAMTGLVGAAQGIAILVLSPIGGVCADRFDRRRLLQISQLAGFLVAAALAVLTLTGAVEAWHVIAASLLSMAATTFDHPTRNALIGSMVPRQQLPQAFALLNPAREVAVLIGPGLAGILIAVGGAGLVHLLDAISYVVMIALLAFMRAPSNAHVGKAHPSVRRAILDGASFVAQRKIVWMLMSLDLSAMLFGAYRVVLPALALDVLHVGPTGYGALAAAPSFGALAATYSIIQLLDRSVRLGRVLLFATLGYGVAAAVLAQSPWFVVSLLAGTALGVADAIATSIRHATVQLETPDELRGRVSSIYQMSSRGGPSLGDALIGSVAGAIGPVAALTVGAAVTVSYASAMLSRPNTVRSYAGENPEPEPVGATARADGAS